MIEIQTNDLTLTVAELQAAAQIAERLSATTISLYRTSEGLRAFVIDSGGAEHTGVQIGDSR